MARGTLFMYVGNSEGFCQGIWFGPAFSCYHREETGGIANQKIKSLNEVGVEMFLSRVLK